MGIRVNQGWEFTHWFFRPNRSFFEKKNRSSASFKRANRSYRKERQERIVVFLLFFVKSDKGDSLSSPFLKDQEEG